MKKTNLYDQKYYEEYEYGFSAEERLDHKRILELFKIKPIDRVLEIGCGLGTLLIKIPSKKKIGIETNDFAIRECREKGLSVIKADAEKRLPFKNFSFDFIVMNEVIEHLKNPENVIRECFRILTPGGKIAITSPARNFFVSGLAESHFSEMTIKELRELVQKCSFKVLSHEVCGISFLYPMMENLLFRPFRFLRDFFKRKQGKKAVKLIDSCHGLADRTFLKPLSFYRKNFMGFGANQLILAEKKD